METGFLTFGELKSHAGNFVQDDSSTFASFIGEEINDYYVMAAKRFDWKELRRLSTSDVTFTAGNGSLYLPRDVANVIVVVDNTNNIFLQQYSADFILYSSPAFYDQSGTAVAWSPIGKLGREADFSSTAEAIRVVSSSSSDTTQVVRFHLEDSNGVETTSITSTLNGTSNVDTASTYSNFHGAVCDDSKVGIITVSGVTSGTVYARIGIDEKTFKCDVLRIYQPSSDANSVALLYKKAVKRMVNDDDVPEIPIAEYLRKIAIAKAFQFDGDSAKSRELFAEAEKLFSEDVDSSKMGGHDTFLAAPRPRPNIGVLNSSWRQSRPYST